jgi:hypothetical protein
MVASINASTSAGVVVTSDTSGSLAFQSNGTTIATISSTGLQQNVGAPAFSAYATSGTSVANNTLTKLTFDTEEFDTNNNFASSRFTPTVAGYYQISGCIGGAFTTMLCTIYKNGTEYKRGVTASGASLNQATVSSIVYLNGSTDYVELYTYQGSGSTQTMSSGINLAYFNGAMVRSA